MKRIAVWAWMPWTILVILIARLWLTPLHSGLWVDELETVFVVRHPGHPTFPIPVAIYYWLPRAATAMFGLSEVVLRMPSVVCMGAALWFLWKIAARIIHAESGWFAVFAALTLRGIDYEAADARPYALGLAVACGGIYCLIRWLDEGRWQDAALLVGFAALVWRVHLLDWPYYVVVVLYVGYRLTRRETAASVAQVLTVTVSTLAALVGPALQAIDLARHAGPHVAAAPPGISALLHELHWNLPVLCGLVCLAIGIVMKGRPQSGINAATWLLSASWWLIHPLALFVYSHVTGNGIFLTRYLSPLLPGLILTTTAVVARWMPWERTRGQWRLAAAVMAIAALIAQGHLTARTFNHENSGWREAAAEVNRFAGSETPVLVPSPFVEARSPVWKPDYPLPGFLYAHLEGYPVSGRLFLLPYDRKGAADYLTEKLDQISGGSKFAAYGQRPAVNQLREWLTARPELAGWRVETREFGDVFVAEFQR